MKKKLLLTVVALTLLLASCGQPAASPTPEPTKSRTPTAVVNEEYLNNFEIVWQTVNDKYFVLFHY